MWTSQVYGHHDKMARTMGAMAECANLPGDRRLTNHSARKHLVQKLRSNNVAPNRNHVCHRPQKCSVYS